MSPRRKLSIAGVCLAGGVGVLVGLGGYTFTYAEGTSYLSNDPNACVNCHIMRETFDAWQKSPHHANATCNDCHVPVDVVGKYTSKAVHGWNHSKAFTLNNFHEPIQISQYSKDIVENNCRRCHTALVAELAVADHASGDCVHCHSGIGHGPRR
jgi:cytochrome c nitrite reductase small subunit